MSASGIVAEQHRNCGVLAMLAVSMYMVVVTTSVEQHNTTMWRTGFTVSTPCTPAMSTINVWHLDWQCLVIVMARSACSRGPSIIVTGSALVLQAALVVPFLGFSFLWGFLGLLRSFGFF